MAAVKRWRSRCTPVAAAMWTATSTSGGCRASRARGSGVPSLPLGTATQGAGLFPHQEADCDEIGRLLELYTADRISYPEMLPTPSGAR